MSNATAAAAAGFLILHVGPKAMVPWFLADHVGLFYVAFTVVATYAFVKTEEDPKSELSYSKFAGRAGKDKMRHIPSRVGMIMLYSPSFLFALYAIFNLSASEVTSRILIVDIMIMIHFAKRVFESMFVHVYSGKMALKVACMIATAYTITSVQTHFATAWSIAEEPALFTNQSPIVLAVGIALFAVGIIGNFYHHIIMASWRSGKSANGEKKYVVPHGGMFGLVACPHYFFEILIWLGISVTSSSMFGYTGVVTATAYLAMRSVKTTAWYREKMEDYPKTRKHLIPYLF
ncbi:hypothetical protein HDU67_007578 [Dinochytrium kinnereticum]|nr:hypothetical protein HDU67_007578 [Dinochytrium kinnereticum]